MSGSRALLLAGAHRHANGNQTADVAHITNSVFHVIHETWGGQNGENTAWQIHGYGTNSYPQFPIGHEAILSTGEDGTNHMSDNVVNLDAWLERKGGDLCLHQEHADESSAKPAGQRGDRRVHLSAVGGAI